ncbi:MAG: DUF2889 domain-containing protein [Sulfuricaulis sp.]|nr:DUF2889 domain-containing protein [Sulfuricaulis sp.]
MSLPTPKARAQLHARNITFRGYKRDDNLWDIEAELGDQRTYVSSMLEKGVVPAGAPIHDMAMRLTLDDTMKICEISAVMRTVPFAECQRVMEPLQAMIGATIGRGWRETIETRLGGIKGCTHLRELLFNIATVAYQTIPPYQVHLRREAGVPADQLIGQAPPPFMGKCMSWDFNGPVVERNLPQFVAWPARRKANAAQPTPSPSSAKAVE